MVDWAEELKKKLQSSQGVDETVKESVSRAADDLAKGEQKIEELSRERESVKQRLLEKVSSIKENFEQGKTYFEDKDFLRAEENFKLVLEIDPSNKEAQSYLEKIYRKIGRPDREAEAEITVRGKADEERTDLPVDQDADLLNAFEGLKMEKEKAQETKDITAGLSEKAPVKPIIEEAVPEEQKAGEPVMKEEETADLKDAFADLKKEMLKREEEPAPATVQEKQEPPAAPAEEKPADVPPEPAPVDTDLTSAFSVLKEEIQSKARPEEKLPAQEAPSPEPAAAPAAEKAPAAAENKEEAAAPADEDLKAALSELTKETAPKKKDEQPAPTEEKKQEPAEKAPEEIDIASALGKLDTLKETAATEKKPAIMQEAAKPVIEASVEKKEEKAAAASGEEDVSDEEFEKLLKESGISGEAAAPAEQTAASPAAAEPEKPAPSAEAKPAAKEEAKAQAAPSPAAPAATPASAKPAEAEAPKKAAEEVQIKEMTAEEVIKEQKTAAQPEGAKKETAPAPAQEKPKEEKKPEPDGLKKLLRVFAPLAVAAVIGMVIASGIMLVVFSQHGKKGTPTEEILDQGIRYVQEGDLAKGTETLSQLEKTFQENNTLMEKYIQAADVIYESETVNADEKVEKYKKAKRIYDQIIGTFPGSPSVLPLYFKAADCSRKLGLFDDAIKTYRKIIDTFTDALMVAHAKYSEGETLDEMKKYDAARELYLGVIEAYPDSEFAVRAYFKLAESFKNQADDLRKEPANE
jgi:tetratricopeptide (TPR) repeat protein